MFLVGRPFRMPTQLSPAQTELRLSEAARLFLEFAKVELQFAAQSIQKYEDCLKRVCRMIGDKPVTEITLGDIPRSSRRC